VKLFLFREKQTSPFLLMRTAEALHYN